MIYSEDIDDFFEGAEKRISVITKHDLSNITITKWCEWINRIGCNVLSIIQNNKYTFYLLSESSCLVGKNYLMIKTCGKTQPLLFLTDVLITEGIQFDSFEYSHSDFLKPEYQPYPYNNISNELEMLSSLNLNNIKYTHHNNRIYCSNGFNKNFFELIAHQFDWPNNAVQIIHNIILSYCPNAMIDDKCFEPCGYSLNMLDDSTYITIHVTPQKSCSYLSVESNCIQSLDFFNSIINALTIVKYKIYTESNDDFVSKNKLILS